MISAFSYIILHLCCFPELRLLFQECNVSKIYDYVIMAKVGLDFRYCNDAFLEYFSFEVISQRSLFPIVWTCKPDLIEYIGNGLDSLMYY